MISPRLDITARWRDHDSAFILAVPNWDFGVVPSAAADRPVNADVVHPIDEELTVTRRVEGDVLDEFSHPVLNVRLPDVPLLEQDNFNGIFASLRNGDFLFPFNDLNQSALLLEHQGGLFPGLKHAESLQRSSDFGHVSVKVNGLKRGESKFPENRNVVLVTERTNHQNSRTKLGFHRRVLHDGDGG